MKLKRIAVLIVMIMMSCMLMSCGEKVEVPTAHVGKRSTADGLVPGIISPSKFRLKFVWPGGVGDSLIICQTPDYPALETMKVYMPKDKMNLEKMEIRGTFAISSKEANVDKVFAKISPEQKTSRIYYINFQKVYKTYAQPVVREVGRSVVTKYSIQEAMINREKIAKEIYEKVNAALANTPIKCLRLGLADLQPPQVIITAQESAKKREIAIEEAENEKMVSLKKAEAALEVAVKQQEVDLKEAETQVLVEKKLSGAVNDAFVTQRALKILDKLATSDNKVFFMTNDMVRNPALVLGTINKAR